MVLCAKLLSTFYPKLTHVTCVVHALHRVCERVREEFPLVNTWLSCLKKVFFFIYLFMYLYILKLNTALFIPFTTLIFLLYCRLVPSAFFNWKLMRQVTCKAPSRVRLYKELYPELPMPPEPVITRFGTWINAASFSANNFEKLKNVNYIILSKNIYESLIKIKSKIQHFLL